MYRYHNQEINDIETIFNRHQNNKTSNIIQCTFTQDNHDKNNQLLEQYDKAGLIKKQNFYCLEEQEMDNPIKQKVGNNFYETVIKNELENDYLYCGYLDNNKSNSESIIQLSCSYCFFILKAVGKPTEKGMFICKKISNVFKDYTETYNIGEVNSMVKDKAITDKLFFNERSTKEEKQKMFIGIKCLECSNLLGVKDSISNNYILFNCI